MLVEFVETALKGRICGGELRQYVAQAWPQDARVGASKEPCGAQAEWSEAISVAFGNAFDHAMETQATELVSHPALRKLMWLVAEQRGQILAQVAIGKACREQLE